MDKGGWFTKNGRGAFGVGLWKDINKETAMLKQHSYFVAGDGKRFRFWKDTWCGTEPLSETFHNIYTMAATKDAYLEDLWDWSREEGRWNSTFLRSFNDWEINDVLNLLATIHRVRLNPDRKDNMVWSLSKSGIFTIKSCYDKLMGGMVENFPRKLILNNCIPTKINFFAWEVWYGKILTMEQLKKRRRHLASRCHLCGKAEESFDHLLLHCPKVYNIWAFIFTIFKVNWVLPRSIKDTLARWKDPSSRKSLRKVWMVAPLCLLWTICKERIGVDFEDMVLSTQRMKNSLMFALWLWETAKSNVQVVNVIDFLDLLVTM